MARAIITGSDIKGGGVQGTGQLFTSSGTTITGGSTLFLTELHPGSIIRTSTQTMVVATITNDTELDTVDTINPAMHDDKFLILDSLTGNGGIQGNAISQSLLQNRIKFVPQFQFDTNGNVIDGRLQSYSISGGPQDITFDGQYVWVACANGGVHKIDPATGSILATGLAGVNQLEYICWDGSCIWVSSQDTNTIYKLAQLDASTVGTYNPSGIPFGLCFAPVSGASYTNQYIYACIKNNDNIKVIKRGNDATDGSLTTHNTVTIGDDPKDICYDGSSLWVTVHTDHRLKSIIESSETVDKNIDLGAGNLPNQVCFDGQNIWITMDTPTAKVKKFDLAGNVLALFAVASFGFIRFNGRYIIDSNTSNSQISIMSPWQVTGVENTFTTDPSPQGVCTDGTYLWIACSSTINRVLL